MPGSGKSIISRTAESMGMKVVRMGDVIRDEAHRQNEDPGKVAVQLRKEYGKYVVAERCVDILARILRVRHVSCVAEAAHTTGSSTCATGRQAQTHALTSSMSVTGSSVRTISPHSGQI